MIEIKTTGDGLVFKVFVQPKSSRNQVAGFYDDALKIKITSPPVDGAANKMCLQFIAKLLGLPKSRLEILSGHTGRTKRILVRTAPADCPDIKNRIHHRLST